MTSEYYTFFNNLNDYTEKFSAHIDPSESHPIEYNQSVFLEPVMLAGWTTILWQVF